jgi:hypothetical protein
MQHYDWIELFLWGYLKSKVYASKPNNLEDLKAAIRNEIQLISNETLVKVMDAVLVRSQECIRLIPWRIPKVCNFHNIANVCYFPVFSCIILLTNLIL